MPALTERQATDAARRIFGAEIACKPILAAFLALTPERQAEVLATAKGILLSYPDVPPSPEPVA